MVFLLFVEMNHQQPPPAVMAANNEIGPCLPMAFFTPERKICFPITSSRNTVGPATEECLNPNNEPEQRRKRRLNSAEHKDDDGKTIAKSSRSKRINKHEDVSSQILMSEAAEIKSYQMEIQGIFT